MSAPAFTPGPWSVYHDGFSVAAEDGHIVSTWVEGAGEKEAQANARLIAAAPELYEALERYVEHLHPHLSRALEAGYENPEHWRLMNAAQAALAKARGEQVSA